MSFDHQALRNAVAEHGVVARVVIAKTAGSAPRNAGTSMLVWQGGQSGTIGGGALEFSAVERARKLSPGQHLLDVVPLGPALGQCCGGSVTLVSEIYDTETLPTQGVVARRVGASNGPAPIATDHLVFKNGWLVEPATSPQREIWIYGAGHVGRALVSLLSPMPDFKIVWIDTAEDRFPRDVSTEIDCIVAVDPTRVTRHAPAHAEHLILTYSHEIDLGLCHALLSQPNAAIGLIGSATKWARFQRRLATLGHGTGSISQIQCPIGDPNVGKHPQMIAIGVVIGMLENATVGGQVVHNDTDAAKA